MAILIKDLQALNRDIKAIENKMDKLIAAVEKGEKPTTRKKTTAKSIKAKPTKRAPARKAPVTRKTPQPMATD